jgi:hypothetical protein
MGLSGAPGVMEQPQTPGLEDLRQLGHLRRQQGRQGRLQALGVPLYDGSGGFQDGFGHHEGEGERGVGLMTDPDWSSSASRRRGFVFHRLPLRR